MDVVHRRRVEYTSRDDLKHRGERVARCVRLARQRMNPVVASSTEDPRCDELIDCLRFGCGQPWYSRAVSYSLSQSTLTLFALTLHGFHHCKRMVPWSDLDQFLSELYYRGDRESSKLGISSQYNHRNLLTNLTPPTRPFRYLTMDTPTGSVKYGLGGPGAFSSRDQRLWSSRYQSSSASPLSSSSLEPRAFQGPLAAGSGMRGVVLSVIRAVFALVDLNLVRVLGLLHVLGSCASSGFSVSSSSARSSPGW